MTRPTLDAIELAWWGPGRARDVALRFNLTCDQVERIWHLMRVRDGYDIKRAPGGFPWSIEVAPVARDLHFAFRAQSLLSIPPITSATNADRLKEVA